MISEMPRDDDGGSRGRQGAPPPSSLLFSSSSFSSNSVFSSSAHAHLANHPALIGLLKRLALVYSLPSLLDDGYLLRGMRYTNVNYGIFVDASECVSAGGSPYDRHTYCYTPFLMWLLSLPLLLPGRGRGTGTTTGGCWHGSFVDFLVLSRYFGKVLFDGAMGNAYF